MKFISFNINGLRARLHQLKAIIDQHDPDVIGLQETKVHDDMFPLEDLAPLGYHLAYYGQKSHYGVAMLTKQPPLEICYGFPNDVQETAQRRMIMVNLATPIGTLTVLNGYFPQGESRNHPLKFPAKEKFYRDLLGYLQQYHTPDLPLLVMGDMNISLYDQDIGIGEENRKRWLRTGKCSFLPEERSWMQKIIEWGMVDTFRHQDPDSRDQFSWFDYRSKGFNDNRGLRIDTILASRGLIQYCREAGIDYNIRAMAKPSDHAPIWAYFSLES